MFSQPFLENRLIISEVQLYYELHHKLFHLLTAEVLERRIFNDF